MSQDDPAPVDMSHLGRLLAHRMFLEERSADLIVIITHLRNMRVQSQVDFYRTWDAGPQEWREGDEGRALRADWVERDEGLGRLLAECERNLTEAIEQLDAVSRALVAGPG